MNRFRFRLQKVLDVRELVLRDAQRTLTLALTALDAAEARRLAASVAVGEAEAAISRPLSEGQWDPRRMLALHNDLNRLVRQSAAAAAGWAAASREVDQSREMVLKRRTEVESLQVLRRRAEESWEENLRRLEAATMDELASVRHQRKRNEEKSSC